MSSRPPTVFPGEVYGRLTVIQYDGLRRGRERTYLCKCECGNETVVPGYLLRSGNTRSCGCLRRDTISHLARTHGHTAKDGKKSPTYETWRGMIQRCRPDYAQSEWYHDRGIKVTPEWTGRTGFASFLKHMGERPKGMTLDRIDPDGNYEPGNCRWASRKEQSVNKRPRARHSEIDRLRKIIAEQEIELKRLRRGVGG